MSSTSHVLSLPIDILQVILDCTPYHSQRALRQTHPLFATLLTPSALKKARSSLRAHLRHCERTGASFPTNLASYLKPASPRTVSMDTHSHRLKKAPSQQHHYPCYTCLLPLPVTHFTPRQLSTAQRICIDCAVTSGRWPPGTSVAGHIVCTLCGGFKSQTVRKGSGSRGRVRETGNSAKASLERVACDDCVETVVRRGELEEGDRFGDRARASHYDEAQLRRGRCQRCWAIDHTEKPVVQEVQGRPLCEGCFALVAVESGRPPGDA